MVITARADLLAAQSIEVARAPRTQKDAEATPIYHNTGPERNKLPEQDSSGAFKELRKSDVDVADLPGIRDRSLRIAHVD